MQTFDTRTIQEQFTALFAATQKHMFKAEVLQDYSLVDDCPSLRAWMHGDKAESKRLALEDPTWTSWRDQCLASPARITRVHVADEPLSPYLAWEIEVLYQTIFLPAGSEDIYLVPSAKLRGIDLPDSDFWIFDNKHVLQWRYDAGKNIGGTVWDESDDIAHFIDLKRKLLAAATPLRGQG